MPQPHLANKSPRLARFAGLLFLGSTALAGAPAMAQVVLPTPDSGFCVAYGDFTSCSLPAAGINVDSTPGKIKDDIVLFTGSQGGPVNDNPTGMDNAYDSSSGGTDHYFDTAHTTDPTDGPSPTPPADQTDTWDAEVGALRTYLAGGELVVFFNLNDTNSVPGLPGQDQLAWVDVTLRDLDGPAPDLHFYLSSPDDPFGIHTAANELADGLTASMGGAPVPDPATNPIGTGDVGADADQVLFTGADTNGTDDGDGIPDAFENIDPQWGYVHGKVCLDDAPPLGNILHLGACQPFDPPGATTVNQNLGADHAAFAVFSTALSAEINDATSPYDVLSARIMLSRSDNGYEQAFILPVTFEGHRSLPAPATVLLVGIGLIGMGLSSRVRRRHG